jgi:hypothetical protein
MAEDYPINREWEPWTEYYLGLRALELRLRAARSPDSRMIAAPTTGG